MKAFLRRRWISLSCIVLFYGLSFVDMVTRLRPLSVEHGSIDWKYWGQPLFDGWHSHMYVHESMLGTMPEVKALREFERIDVSLPLWMPLTAVFGWLVIRELFGREKRSKPLTPPES